jgi:spore maturation protein SpmA
VGLILGALLVANVLLLRALRRERTIADRSIALNLLVDTAAIALIEPFAGAAIVAVVVGGASDAGADVVVPPLLRERP